MSTTTIAKYWQIHRTNFLDFKHFIDYYNDNYCMLLPEEIEEIKILTIKMRR